MKEASEAQQKVMCIQSARLSFSFSSSVRQSLKTFRSLANHSASSLPRPPFNPLVPSLAPSPPLPPHPPTLHSLPHTTWPHDPILPGLTQVQEKLTHCREGGDPAQHFPCPDTDVVPSGNRNQVPPVCPFAVLALSVWR
jgi:hypothetical protein